MGIRTRLAALAVFLAVATPASAQQNGPPPTPTPVAAPDRPAIALRAGSAGREQWESFFDQFTVRNVTHATLYPVLPPEAARNGRAVVIAPGGGYRPLRRALSDYLRVARSVKCTPDQIIITTGIHQSIDLAVAAEELGADGAFFRVHHFARQLGSPFPLLAAVGAKTKRIEIGTTSTARCGGRESFQRAIVDRCKRLCATSRPMPRPISCPTRFEVR